MKEGQFEGVDFLVRAGRAVMFPIYKDSYERLGVVPDPGTIAYRDETIQQSKDLRRAVDAHRYRPQPPCLLRRELGRRSGADHGCHRKPNQGRSPGSRRVRPRQGIARSRLHEFAPHGRVPTILLNGRYDFMFPLDTCQEPLFHALGTPPQNKRLVLFDSGHSPPETPKMKKTLDWLDKYLGPVK